MTDYEDARKRWLAERPEYERFTKLVIDRLRGEVRQEGIWASIDGRAKEIDSLIRKLVKKPEHTYESLGDRAGVRVVVRYKDEIDLVLRAAARAFECSEPEDKRSALKHDRVGYLSTHVDIWLRDSDRSAKKFPPSRFRAELQVRTLAQHLWSEMSHDTFYKSDETLTPIPEPMKRRVYLLAGVVEVADDEFTRIKLEMPPVPEVELLKALERHYYKLSSRRSDVEASLDVIRLLFPLYHSSEARQVVARLDDFYAKHESVLQHVFSEYEGRTDRSAYLLQPEALMIYERLENDAMAARTAWNTQYPPEELERFANAFGISFD